ncbi:DUF4136 domain-containing protein [Christiangramia aquimixticola]|uniref:DUF4136 domain-containing protein n=1 Tax=Christiangramia aquimixticola TaxID=1697558 RepID=UPI003AA95A54
MRLFKISILLLLITACNSPRAVIDYDQNVEFQQYSTYSVYPELQTGLSQLNQSRLLNSLNSQMINKGFSKTEEPDIYVNVYSTSFERDNRSRVGLGIGGGGGNVGVGVSGGIPVGQMDTYLKLTFDFIDVEKDVLVWQAIVESPFNLKSSPENRQQQLDKIVRKALDNYPPGK